MAAFQKIVFKELCLNNVIVTLGSMNECEISQQHGRSRFALNLQQDFSLELDLQDSLAEFKYSKWDPQPDSTLVLECTLRLTSIPPWVDTYSTASPGCIQWIIATMLVKNGSQLNYEAFVSSVCSVLSKMQCKGLETPEAQNLWKERTTPKSVVKGVKLTGANFGDFSLADLERLKNDNRWLSDSHVTLALQACFRDCFERNLWGNQEKIKLLDTSFWQLLSEDPNIYTDRYRTRQKLMECDFAIMPMFESNHWRLGIIEKPAELIQGNTVFHVLDSLSKSSPVTRETRQLQTILLRHFEGEVYKEGRMAANVPEVPQQPNKNDCACFTIYFAQKFMHNPEDTMSLIKTSFLSTEDRMAAWGLKNSDLTFVRRELRTLLFKYIKQGDAVVEFQ